MKWILDKSILKQFIVFIFYYSYYACIANNQISYQWKLLIESNDSFLDADINLVVDF